MYNNILDVYKHLYLMSDNITGETIDYNRGFQDAIYMLHLTLKRYEHINLHVENKRLSRSLYLAQLALDDRYEDRDMLKQQISDLKQQLNKCKPKQITFKGDKIYLNKVEIHYEEHVFTFYINTDNDTFMFYFDAAQREAVKKRVRHATDIKARVMQYYRSLGFKCESK